MELYSQNEIQHIRKIYCTKQFDNANYRDLSYHQNKKILLWTRKPGLGDMIMNAIVCDILRNKFGLDVWFGCRYNPCDKDFPDILKNVPTYKYQPDLHKFPVPNNPYPRGFENGFDHQGDKHPFDFILDFRYYIHAPQNIIFQCLKEFGINEIDTNINGFRIKEDILKKPDKIYDIIMCCSTGGWKPLRAYRKNQELKQVLEQRGYSVLDLTEYGKSIKNVFGVKGILSLVKWAKCYIGVETGPTHLVSEVSNKSIILQSGIHHSAFWNIYKNTYPLEFKLTCGGRMCKARTHEQCPQEKVCIDEISIEKIVEKIEI